MTRDLLLVGGRILVPGGSTSSMLIRQGVVAALGVAPEQVDADVFDLGGRTARPGYVDVHCHGGGGVALYTGDSNDVAAVAGTHLRHGTTSMLASLTAGQPAQLIRAVRAIVDAVRSGTAPTITGIHFEGPYLSPKRPGAQPVGNLRGVDSAEIDRLVAACGDLPISMTIAPEIDGALEVIARLHERVTFFIGHTDATAAQFDAAIDAGARGVTHLFNAMPALHHRAPGPAARALVDNRVVSEVILDGHHLDDDIVRLALTVAGPDRLMLVTDAMAAAGVADGDYVLPGLQATVIDGAAYVSGTRTLAGSTLTMDRAVQRLIALEATDEAGVVHMASANAARLMGWSDRGELGIGRRADIVVTDDSARVQAVFLGGNAVTLS